MVDWDIMQDITCLKGTGHEHSLCNRHIYSTVINNFFKKRTTLAKHPFCLREESILERLNKYGWRRLIKLVTLYK